MKSIKTAQGQNHTFRDCEVKLNQTSTCTKIDHLTKDCHICEEDNCNGEGF